jgi:hypothetical protein
VQAAKTVTVYEIFQNVCNAIRDRRGPKENSLRRSNRERGRGNCNMEEKRAEKH